MTVFAPYAKWMGKHKTFFFIVNIIIQWINETVELFLLRRRIQKTYISEIYFWISYSQGSYLKIIAVIIISKNKMRTTQFSEYLPFFFLSFFFVLLFYFDDCFRQILTNISKVLTNKQILCTKDVGGDI